KQNVRDHAAAIEEAVRALRQRARELKAKPLAKLADDLEQMLAAARKKAKGAGDQLGKSDVQDIRQRAKQDVQLMSNVTEKQRDVAMAIIEKI
ncbi:MAG: hypothetical protein KC583_04600, partial [Myxococcales bacterium]|nr:hypothetical protein [Myxococcales bacterium]